jgi:aryl-alcohol dehydrogenase-like predicted oxidoreductase
MGPVVVIPGASSFGQLEASVAAVNIVLREDERQGLAVAASEVREGRPGVSS